MKLLLLFLALLGAISAISGGSHFTILLSKYDCNRHILLIDKCYLKCLGGYVVGDRHRCMDLCGGHGGGYGTFILLAVGFQWIFRIFSFFYSIQKITVAKTSWTVCVL